MFHKPSPETLLHYGTKRHSGRYPWGSGEDPQQSEGYSKFLADVDELRSQGLKATEIADKLGMNTTQLRNNITWANAERDKYNIPMAGKLKDTGMSNVAIGKKLGVSEATVRNYLKTLSGETDASKVNKLKLDNITEAIKNGVDNTGYLDVGVGVERQLGVSRTRFNAMVNKLVAEEGYHIHEAFIKRLSDNTVTDPANGVFAKYTTVKVLTKDPDVANTRKNSNLIRPLDSWSDDGGLTLTKTYPPHMLDPQRVHIRYHEDGGSDKDGLIELRPGVKDLDLGKAKYAQVRIATKGNLYLKGMAAYTDEKNFPDGVDIIFNTNKKKDVPFEKVLKKMKTVPPEQAGDPSALFGSSISKQKGAINIVNQQNDWDTWSTKMSSQFLSKQPVNLIKDRLDDTQSALQKEFDDINSMTNPVVKKYLMDEYIQGLDSKARHLKAKGLKDTKSHVLLPFPDMNPGEIYAPNYADGTRVVLVRHPHGGIFEIPDLVVNNKNEAARKMIGANAPDAVGIHPSVAGKLSGADFDGDTALVIPNNQGKIKTSRSLKELKNFDPHVYKVGPDSPKNIHKVDKETGELVNTGHTITPDHKQTQMGLVSNLITDMTIKMGGNINEDELARAVKHSMVVIDSEKHNLDWKQSAIDNGISALRRKYQSHINPDTGKKTLGASTLISRSKNKVDISDATKITKSIENSLAKADYLDGTSPQTSLNVPKEEFNTVVKKLVKTKGYYVHDVVDASGNKRKIITKDPNIDNVKKNIKKVQPITPWEFNPDKYTSGTAKEQLYADYIKSIQSIKNTALKTSLSIETPPYSKEAAKKYATERQSMNVKLNEALLNAPKERQAQILTNKLFYANFNKDMSKDEVKKLKNRALSKARDVVGANKKAVTIKLNAKEWEAIQAGAVSTSTLVSILKNADMDIIRELAAPHQPKLNTAKATRAKLLLEKGYTYAQVADQLGVSTTALREELR
jgi:predicted transcriptional regulator